MKKLITTAFLAVLVTTTALAQGWPANYGGVMLQGFFWDSWTSTPLHGPQGGNLNHLTNYDKTPQDGYTWATMYGAGWGDAEEWQVPISSWTNLLAHKAEITPFIDLIWLPQSGSTICPPRSKYYKASDNSGRNGSRAWRRGDSYNFNDGDEINNPDCMGFVPVFYFHHGEPGDGSTYTYTYHFGDNNQESKTFTPKSYFGTEKELRELISAYKAEGTGAVEDVVANHRGCFGTWNFDFTGQDGNNYTYNSTKANLDFPTEWYYGQFRGLTWDQIRAGQTRGNIGSGDDHEEISWSTDDVCRDDESASNGGHPTGNYDCGGKGEWARDIDHHNPATRAKVVKYLDFLKNDLGYLGFRYDYAMGFEGVHYAEYNTTLRPTYSVGEYWGSQGDISRWIQDTNMEGSFQSAAFDFPLMYAINDAFNNWNFRALKYAGMIANPYMRRYAVTFVDNHDTAKDLPTDGSNPNYNNRTNSNIVQANAFILAMPGTPCLFYPQFMHPNWHDQICNMIKARRAAGVHNMSDYEISEYGNNGITWFVTGTKGQVCLQLGDAVAQGVPDGFQQVYISPSSEAPCRYSITSSLDWQNNVKAGFVNGYPIFSRPSCTFEHEMALNIRPSLPECVLVYTTDNTEPTANNGTRITNASGVDLTFTKTTVVKVGVLVGGVSVESVETRKYVENGTDAEHMTIYVDTPAAPNLYLWSSKNENVHPNGNWAGNKTTQTKTVGGVTWHCKTFDYPDYSNGESYNLKINWDGKSESPTITGIAGDIYIHYHDGLPYNVTNDYIDNVLKLDADKESGIYDGILEVALTANVSDETIVYTTDGSDPSSSSAQFTGGGTVKFDINGSHVLRAGILKDGQVINELTRTYVIAGGTAIDEGGINIFVHETNDRTTYVHYWPSPTSTSPEAFTNEFYIDGKRWQYRHFDTNANYMNFLFTTTLGGWNDKCADITNVGLGNHFYEYNASGPSCSETTETLDKNNCVTVYVDSNWDPYLYAWTGEAGSEVKYAGGWPGIKLTTKNHTTSDGKTWYKWAVYGLSSVNVILNDNDGGQTQTIELGPGEHYLVYNNNNGVDHNSYNDVTSNYTHRIGDINEALLYEIESNGTKDNYYTVTENLTVGYVDAENNTLYAFNASTDASAMQAPGANETDYLNSLGHATTQRDWVKITGYTNTRGYSVGDVLSNVTGKLTNVVNPTIDVITDPIKARSGDEVDWNYYTPCNFQSSQTQTSDNGNGRTYFFFRPQANEVAHIMGAIYLGEGIFEVPTRQTLQNGTVINGAELEGSITVDVKGVNLPESAIGKVVEFDAIISRTGGGSGMPRRIAGEGYSIKAISANAPHDVTTAVSDVKQAAEVASVRFMNLAGQVSSQPFTGLNIVVTTMTDGSVTTKKVFK